MILDFKTYLFGQEVHTGSAGKRLKSSHSFMMITGTDEIYILVQLSRQLE